MTIRLHVDDAILLRRAIDFTARETGYVPRLVEKDYASSVVLEYLARAVPNLAFKGGTCLSKVYSRFYRLSEDLDFSIPMAPGAARAERSRSIEPVRAAMRALAGELPGFRMIQPLAGFNGSTQYTAKAAYESLLDGRLEPVAIEIGMREPNLLNLCIEPGRTVLLNPITGSELVPTIRFAHLPMPK